MKARTMLKLSLAAFFLIATSAQAVVFGEGGLGQALIFPYYTVRPSNGDTQNTYISIVNGTTAAKAIRLRVREGVGGQDVGAFNLFLGPNDTWAAAMVPDAQGPGAKLLSVDRSCQSGAINRDDGSVQLDVIVKGVGNERFADNAREGFIEVIEMAVLTGNAASALQPGSNGVPANCASLSTIVGADITAPTGGLSGTFTVINVANALEFSGNATALGNLSTTPFYRPAIDPYPGFASTEIDPLSVVMSGGFLYRSRWSRAVDAVTAVLMNRTWSGEFVLDPGTASKTDVVLTFPTWPLHMLNGLPQPPVSSACADGEPFNQEAVAVYFANREGQSPVPAGSITPMRCAASEVFDFRIVATPSAPTATSVVGSKSFAFRSSVIVSASAPNGSFTLTHQSNEPLTSLPTSVRINVLTGESLTGAHTYRGLPIIGFVARTLQNGALACSAGTCLGSYGAAFPLRLTRAISP